MVVGIVVFLWTTLGWASQLYGHEERTYQIVTLAEKPDLEPGQSAQVTLGMAFWCLRNSWHRSVAGYRPLFISISRGGGHLGRQGYIYASDPKIKPVFEHGFPLALRIQADDRDTMHRRLGRT